jgi:ribonuclease PH
LALAVRRLLAAGSLKKSPLRDSIAATSVGIVDGSVLLDLAYEEDSRAEVDMNIVMTGSGKFVELQATAEQVAFDDKQLSEMLALGRQGVTELMALQQAALDGAR